MFHFTDVNVSTHSAAANFDERKREGGNISEEVRVLVKILSTVSTFIIPHGAVAVA